VILIDNHSRVPIYQQVKEQIIMLINTGVYKPNDQLSSIRNLSKELDININTIKRAFAELESDGVVYSVQGKGVFVSENPLGNENIAMSALKDVATAVTSAKAMGVTKEQVKNLVDNIYEAGESDD
jgi:GntR family transcriptional regulator